MKRVFLHRYFFAIVVGLVLVQGAFADKASYVTKPQAEAAAATLRGVGQIKHFCAPCRDAVVRDERVASVVVSKVDEQNFWTVVVNQRSIDLAYVYFPLADGNWKNLAAHVGLRYAEVPEFLSGQTPRTPAPKRVDVPPAPPNNNAVQWMPVVEMDRQIFPSFFLATATQPIVESRVAGVIGDAQGKIGMHIINPQPNTRLKIAVEIDAILRYQEFEATLAEKGRYYQIYPKLNWNWDALKRFKKPSPANATFALYLNGQLIDKQTVVVRVRSINESVYAYSYLLDENRWASTGWLFAAYVNEDHEWIDQILREALNTRLVDSFIGYQGKPEQVINQVFAIWHVLQKRGFRYSSITATSGTGTTTKVFSQYVRFFEESINASQANCVDGTVLIASILKKIGLRVGLVLVPGHCFLVFDADGRGNWRGLETTMMGNVDLARYPDEAAKVKASMQGFIDAVTVGNKTFLESLPKINENHPQYKLVDVGEARKAGIFPIA